MVNKFVSYFDTIYTGLLEEATRTRLSFAECFLQPVRAHELFVSMRWHSALNRYKLRPTVV